MSKHIRIEGSDLLVEKDIVVGLLIHHLVNIKHICQYKKQASTKTKIQNMCSEINTLKMR